MAALNCCVLFVCLQHCIDLMMSDRYVPLCENLEINQGDGLHQDRGNRGKDVGGGG